MRRIGLAAFICTLSMAGFAAARPVTDAGGDKRVALTVALPPVPRTKSSLVKFDVTPFPFHGEVPATGKPFLDVSEGKRLGHSAPRGGVYWEDETYSDRRVLLTIPRGFNPRLPAVMVVFFHGNNATLERDVRDRQQVPRQIAQSGLNAVLVAPQFAVDAADSSAGRFCQPGVFASFLDEAAEKLTGLIGSARARRMFGAMPVIIVAYSGGYYPAAYALSNGGANDRLSGLVLLDALYSDQDKFASWIQKKKDAAFLVSAYGPSSSDGNLSMQDVLAERKIAFVKELPPKLGAGSIVFVPAGSDVEHNDFVTHAWTDDPLSAVLSRITAFPRTQRHGVEDRGADQSRKRTFDR